MATTPAMPVFLTPRDVAQRLNLSLTGVYALCDAGELPCHKIGAKGGRRRISEADLQVYLQRTREARPATIELPRRGRKGASGVDGGFRLLRAGGWKG